AVVLTRQRRCPGPGRLRGLLGGTLPADERRAVSEHLEGCPRCQRALEDLAAGREWWSGAVRELAAQRAELDPALRHAVRSRKEGTEPARTEAEANGVGEAALHFLGPSKRPDSLGRLGHYEILGVVGAGGMGMVLKAFDESLHRVVAVKVMAPQLATSGT